MILCLLRTAVPQPHHRTPTIAFLPPPSLFDSVVGMTQPNPLDARFEMNSSITPYTQAVLFLIVCSECRLQLGMRKLKQLGESD